MINKKIVLFIAFSLVSSSVFAFGESPGLSAKERWHSLPEEKQVRIAEKAAEERLALREELQALFCSERCEILAL